MNTWKTFDNLERDSTKFESFFNKIVWRKIRFRTREQINKCCALRSRLLSYLWVRENFHVFYKLLKSHLTNLFVTIISIRELAFVSLLSWIPFWPSRNKTIICFQEFSVAKQKFLAITCHLQRVRQKVKTFFILPWQIRKGCDSLAECQDSVLNCLLKFPFFCFDIHNFSSFLDRVQYLLDKEWAWKPQTSPFW